MTVEQWSTYLLSLDSVTKSYPFDDKVAVYKVDDKMFALVSDGDQKVAAVMGGNPIEELWQTLDNKMMISLKCDPDKAIDYRTMFVGVLPGYHLNKRLWNTVFLEADVPDTYIKQMIDESYELVVRKLPKERRMKLMAK